MNLNRSDTLTIDQMTEQDLDQVLLIEGSSFTHSWSRQSFESELSRNRLAVYRVARLDGQVVGYGGIWVILDEAHLTTLAVDQVYRGQGIATALLQELMESARRAGASKMTLEVRPSNLVARRLYERFGFVVKGVRKKYYLDEDALLMTRDEL